MKTQFVRKLFAPLAIVAALGLASGQGLAADIKERNLKFPIVNAIDHPQGLGAQKFVEVVDKKSGGKIKIKIFPNGTLGGEQQVAAAMQGTTGCVISTPSWVRPITGACALESATPAKNQKLPTGCSKNPRPTNAR